jgi:hypothetical protein
MRALNNFHLLPLDTMIITIAFTINQLCLTFSLLTNTAHPDIMSSTATTFDSIFHQVLSAWSMKGAALRNTELMTNMLTGISTGVFEVGELRFPLYLLADVYYTT